MLAMLHGAGAPNTVASRPVWWLHSARNRAHHSFAKEAGDFLVALHAYHRCVMSSRPGPGDALGQDSINQAISRSSRFTSWGFPRTLISICAVHPAFLKISSKAWRHGHSPAQGPRRSVPGPRPPSRRASPASPRLCLTGLTTAWGGGPMVTFLRSGLSVPWDARFGSLLELAEACAVPVRWACRSGVCHNCESGLIEGELAYAPEPLDPPAEGNALICCSTPRTAVELEPL